jgi:hypothetical protein
MDDSSSLEKKSDKEEDSIINRFLDVINIKEFLEIIFSKIHIKTSDSFISGFILAIFLIWLYHELSILELNLSSWMVVLYVLFIFLFLDFLGKNTDTIKKFLFNEENNRNFLNNINSYDARNVQNEILLRNFSPLNINFYLNKIEEEPQKESGFIFENIIINNDLTVENLNKIFSPRIRIFLRENLVIDLLIKYRNRLSINNIKNLYDYYGSNERILKFIFATQNQSEFLKNENIELLPYFEKYRLNKTSEFVKINNELIKNDISNFREFTFRSIITLLIFQFMVIFFIGSVVKPQFISSAGYVDPFYNSILMFLFFLSFCISLIAGFSLASYLRKERERIREQFKEIVEKIE